jgi:hypothetical protein
MKKEILKKAFAWVLTLVLIVNEKFIGNGIICNIPGKKYVLNIENMMALYCILCSGWKEKTGKYISRSFIQMIEVLRGIEKERQGYSKAIFYLPVFVCSYYLSYIIHGTAVKVAENHIVSIF